VSTAPSKPRSRHGRLPRRIHPVWVVAAAASHATFCKTAQAQLLDRYYPANVGAYQDWAASTTGAQIDQGYAPLGIRLGDFIISPTADIGIGYETDPFATANATASAVLQTDATLRASSDWARNSVSAYLAVDNSRYINLGRSVTDWTAAAGSRIQVAEDVIDLGYAHINAVALPTDIGAFGQPRAVVEQNDDLRASYTIGVGRISLVPALQGDIFTFGLGGGGGGALPEGDGLFDRDALTASLTANYQFAGGHNLVAILSDSVVRYGGGQSPLRPADYNDSSFLVGIEYKSSALLTYRALVGYEERIPTGHGTTDSTLGAPAAELDVIYKPTVLTTLTGKLSQSFENSPTDSGQGLSETSLQLVLDHSLSRRVQLQASARLIRATFANDGGSELEVAATARAEMHLTRHIVISAEYDFSESSGGNAQSISFRNHEVLLRGRLQW
jgi:hypothetical protein